MWKKEDVKPQGIPEKPAAHVNAPTFGTGTVNPPHVGVAHPPQPVVPPPLASAPPRGGTAVIGQGIRIKGEVTGSEDLFVDGLIDGQLNLSNGSLTVGPNGTVKADVVAREVIVRGRIDGKVSGRDKVQLMASSQVTGEVQTDRLAIEEGALLRGKVEAGRLPAKAADARGATAAGAGNSKDVLSASSESAAD